MHCSYLKPIHYGDDIYVTTLCSEIGDKSFTLEQELIDGTREVRSHCRTVMVYIDPSTGRPARVPDDYRAKIKAYQEKDKP